MALADVASIRGAEANVAVSCGGDDASGFAVDIEGRRASLVRATVGIGGSTGGPIPVPVGPPIVVSGEAGTGIRVGTGAITEAGSVRLIRSPEISSSRTALHVQRISRAHSRMSGKRMRKWSSWTTSVSERTVVAKKPGVRVDPVAVAVVEDGGANKGDKEGGMGKVEEVESGEEGGG